MEGFFSRDQIEKMQARTISDGSCLDCGAYQHCKNPKIKLQNISNAKNLLLVPKPSEKDDESGEYLSGDSGDFLKKKFAKRKTSPKSMFAYLGAVQCHMNKVTDLAINSCRSRTLQTIKKFNPLNIVTLGNEPLKSLLGKSFKNTSIFRFRGLIIPDQKLKAWIVPIFNPAFIMQKEKDANAQAFYDHDIARMLRHIRTCREFPVIPDEKINVICLTDYEQIIQILKKIYDDAESIVIDYEATGIKPYIHGHKIVSVSIDWNGTSYSFPFQYRQFFTQEQQETIRFQLKRIWMNKFIKKIAHNAKFEHIWTKQIIKASPVNWHWCTMMGAHCQDNRQGYSGLKFQTYVNFGHRPYNDETAPYIDSRGAEFNRMDECPLDILLPYGGLDTRWCRRLYDKQVLFYKKNKKMKEAFNLFNEGAIVLAELQENGIPVDEEYCFYEKNHLNRRIKIIEDQLFNSEEAHLFKKHTGRELQIKEKDFSDHDLRILFYDILGFDTDKQTEKSKSKSVAKDVLASFDNQFAKMILKRRKLRKISGTYLNQFIRETHDGMLHPFFDLLIPASYRGSCYAPAFQTIPKRDEEAKKSTRRAIKPFSGYKILESDFSGIEVCTNACYNHDPTLIKNVTDPKADMHRDTAAELFKLPKNEIQKKIRFYAKNQWVFPQFYGSWYEECAKNLWESCLPLKTKSGFTIIDHLKSKGIITLEQFSEHCKKVEDNFWNVRFKVYNQWKKDIQKEYQKNGFIETFIGFRFSQLMAKNEITNYDAQGTGFHCLLWTLIQVHNTMIKENMKSKLMGQIHDSMLTNLHPDEEKMQIQIIDHWGTDMIRKHWPWIIVPLNIEHEITEINGTWYDKKEIK